MDAHPKRTKPWLWVLIAVGTVALFVSISADLGGFFGGMLQGAGFAVAVLGAYLLGALPGVNGIAGGVGRASWLPSRDGRH